MLRHIIGATLFLSLLSFQVAKADFEVETLAQAALQRYTEDHSKLVRKSNPKEEFQWNDRALKCSEFPNIVLRRYIGAHVPPGKNRYQVFQTDENGTVVANVSNDLLFKILKENAVAFDGAAILKENGKALPKHRDIYKFKDKYYEIRKGFDSATKKEFDGWVWIEYVPGLGEKSEEELRKDFYSAATLTNTALLKWIGMLQPGAAVTSIEGKVTLPYQTNDVTLEYTLEQSILAPRRVIIDQDRLFYKYDPLKIIGTIKTRDISTKPHAEKVVAKLDLTQTPLPTIDDNDIVLGTPGKFEAFSPEGSDRNKPLGIEKPETQIRQAIRQFPSDKTFYVLLSPKSDFLSPEIKKAIETKQELSKFAYDDVHYYTAKRLFQNVRYEFEGVEKGYVVMRVDPL